MIHHVRKAYTEVVDQRTLESTITENPPSPPALAAVQAYQAIDSSPFLDTERETLSAIVKALTGFVPAGYKSDRRGETLFENGKPVLEDAAIDHTAKPKPTPAPAQKPDTTVTSANNKTPDDGGTK